MTPLRIAVTLCRDPRNWKAPLPETAERLRIDVHLNGDGVLDSLADDVRKGLSAIPKQLPPKYFYDDAGSDLFEQITALPEYYPTRAERALLERLADALMSGHRPAEVVELGSGSCAKTRVLLGAASAPKHLRRYIPFDVSEGMVRASALELLREVNPPHWDLIVAAPWKAGRQSIAFSSWSCPAPRGPSA